MYIIVKNSDQVVTDIYHEPLPVPSGSTQYEVELEIPVITPGQILKYDGTNFSIDPNVEVRMRMLEPRLIDLYQKWQISETLNLLCKEDCKAHYDMFKAEYDALLE